MKEYDDNLIRSGFDELLKALDLDFGLTDKWVDYIRRGPLFIIPSLESYLEIFESVASKKQEQLGKIQENINYDLIQQLFAKLYYDRLASLQMGPDFELELREPERIITEDTYPSLWLAFVIIPGDRGHGLEREDHGPGYHIHYITFQSKKRKRTDVVFTFHPSEPPPVVDKLYWFKHGVGRYAVQANPASFRLGRKRSIHSCAKLFLKVIPKPRFQMPPAHSSILYP